MPKFKLKDEVHIGPFQGKIIRVLHSGIGTEYQVAYFDGGGERKTEWFFGYELEAITNSKLGFKGAEK